MTWKIFLLPVPSCFVGFCCCCCVFFLTLSSFSLPTVLPWPLLNCSSTPSIFLPYTLYRPCMYMRCPFLRQSDALLSHLLGCSSGITCPVKPSQMALSKIATPDFSFFFFSYHTTFCEYIFLSEQLNVLSVAPGKEYLWNQCTWDHERHQQTSSTPVP